MTTFAQRLAEAYHARTEQSARSIEFHAGTTTDGVIRAMARNTKLVERISTGAVRFPLDLLEAWGEALPDDLGLEFRRTMARRLGFVGVLPPSDAGAPSDVGALAAEFGATMQALAPLLEDGRIDADDCPGLIRRAMREGADLMAAWLAVQQQLVSALPGASAREGSHA